MKAIKHAGIVMMMSIGMTLLAGLLPCQAEEPQPVYGGKLVYAIPGNPDTLDPQATTGTLTFQYLKSVYDTLVEPNEAGELVPALAESWEFSTSDLTLSFHLRAGVTFHNGDRLTADDVKATFDRILAEDSTSPHKPNFEAVREIVVVDDATVTFVLKELSMPLLGTLGSGWSAILPKSAIDAGHDFSAHPIGTGPFVFQEWVRDDRASYTKFADYWQAGRPYLDAIEMKDVIETTTQLNGLETGDFDIIHFVETPMLPRIEHNPETKVFTHPTSLALVVTLNHARPPFDNVLVRRAVTQALDRQALLDIAYTGGTIIGAFIDAGNVYYTDYGQMYPYNPQKAKDLLAEAGYPDGFEVTLTLPQNYVPHVNAGSMVQNMLAQVGVTAKIELVDWGTWLSRVHRDKDYDMTVIGHTGKLDPDSRLRGLDYTNYHNPELDNLIREAAKTPQIETRKALYGQVQKLLAEDAVMVFIGTPLGLRGLRSNVYGFRMTYALETPDFRDTYKLP